MVALYLTGDCRTASSGAGELDCRPLKRILTELIAPHEAVPAEFALDFALGARALERTLRWSISSRTRHRETT